MSALFDDVAGAINPERLGPATVMELDAIEMLKKLPDESVDLIVTDPAYESLEKHRAVGTTTRLKKSDGSSNEWFPIFPNHRFPTFFAECYRVLAKNAHFYMFSDQETMHVVKPMLEAARLRFWKFLVWDKCIDPSTPVWTERGVIPAEDVRAGDRVASPDGARVDVLAVRRTRAPATRIEFDDGSSLFTALDHRFALATGGEIEAGVITPDTRIAFASPGMTSCAELRLRDILPREELALELPDRNHCLFCGEKFESPRGSAAHQARYCEHARSKESMARAIDVPLKRLQYWMSVGALPVAWAEHLGIEPVASGRCRYVGANDRGRWLPDRIVLDEFWGRVVGLYAAEGSRTQAGVAFTLHRDEKHLAALVGRAARSLGVRAIPRPGNGEGLVVNVSYSAMRALMLHFVGGDRAPDKFFKTAVYDAPEAFRRGVLAGLLEGDGHWSHEEQRETLNTSSLDLACFAFRELKRSGQLPTISSFSNEGAGGWRVRVDPRGRSTTTGAVVTTNEPVGERPLIDIAIDSSDQLFVLGTGVVTHNCRIGMGYHYRGQHELILFCEKGRRPLNDLGVPDIIRCPRITKAYPTEKPSKVSEILVLQSSDQGEVVVDPFCGSGSVGDAATSNGRRFLGGDISAKAVACARARLGLEG